ncbi:hypothetical protein [Saccharopolyspora pogona]|nr:hypothetical protein [Saccharopolyspora pogona]
MIEAMAIDWQPLDCKDRMWPKSTTDMDRVERAIILPFSLVRPAVVYC